MPEHLVALVFVLMIAITVFVLARESASPATMSEAAYLRRRNVWIAVTLLAFLSHNFWIFIVLCWVLLAIERKKDINPLALYCILLFAVPTFFRGIPGFGIVNALFPMSYTRLLSLVILLPVAFRLFRSRTEQSPGLRAVDLLFSSFMAWIIFRHSQQQTPTVVVRETFLLFLDVMLPYYVASRAIRSAEQLREVASALVLACMIVAVVNVFETVKNWHLYVALRYALGLPATGFFEYQVRGDGILRAQASVLHPIAAGYVTMVGLGFAAMVAPLIRPQWKLRMTMFSLIAGLVAGMSRGPWVGAAVMIAVIFVLDPSVSRRVSRLVGSIALAAVLLFMTPLGPTIVDFLPFVGTVESANIDYRQQLFEVSLEVIKQNPWQGDLLYLANPLMEQMRQGQGIIDVVNTYLGYALPYGVIGLTLFVLPFLVAARAVRKAQKAAAAEAHSEIEIIGRCLLGIMIGILLTIATTSSISVIPTLYWLTLGLCVSFVTVSKLAIFSDAKETKRPRYATAGRQRLSEGY
jgi:O-antigen ligase